MKRSHEDRSEELTDKIAHDAKQDTTIKCHYCDAKFTDKISFINHMKRSHDLEESDLNISKNCKSSKQNPSVPLNMNNHEASIKAEKSDCPFQHE